MKYFKLYILFFVIIFLVTESNAQVLAPSLKCLSVNGSSVTLTWTAPADPSGLFTRYEIYSAATQSGPFVLIGSVNNYAQTFYVHSPTNGSVQSQYYYIITISGGVNASLPSDTLRSVFVNLNNSNGRALLNWNATHTPLLPGASSTYTLSRQTPTTPWTDLYIGNGLNYIDSISICSIYYSYKITTSNAAGCVSESNINGSLFFDFIQPFVPTLDSISVNGSGYATLGWQPSASADAVGYIIFKQIGGIWTAVDTVSGRNNTVYTYANSTAVAGSESYFVTSIDSCKNISPPGIEQKTMFLSSTYDLCSRSASLTWTPYGSLPKGVLRYDIYASTTANYSLVGSSNTTSFTHSNLNPGDNYCYVIKVVNADESITANSNSSCVFAKVPQGPAYVYIRSVSVNLNKNVEITYTVDNSKPFKGATIFKSEDGINFNQLSFNSSTTNSIQTYIDENVTTKDKNYYYKVQLIDSCGNPGMVSNTSKTILLRVSNDTKDIYKNILTWDDYSTWSGNVSSYNIYRAVNGIFDPTPISNVFFTEKTYVDDVEGFSSENGKFSYYIEAVEGLGNIYGFNDRATSNVADAYVEGTIFVPNAFAPKGLNNIWLPVTQFVEKTDYHVIVFNRWGAKVFETTSDTEGWNGNNSTDAVYVYFIEYKNARGEHVELKGHLNVLK